MMAESSASAQASQPEKVPLQFLYNADDVPPEMAQVMAEIKQLAEKMLYHWKNFPIVLPPSLTKQADDKGVINYRDLFIAPTFDELEQVATDAYGDLKKLSDAQLQSVWDSGEFDVPSINFPGQFHRWRLSQLFQKGSKNARSSLLDNVALALRLIIITARNRFISRFFSLSESCRSWGTGLWKILDILIGMPATSAAELETKIHEENMRYLVAELDVKQSSRDGFSKFCTFVKEKSRLSTYDKFKTVLRPPPIPYIYQTPKGMDVDLRLYNKDLINNCLPVLGNILERESKGWYIRFRQKLLMDLKGQGLSNEELSKRVNDGVKQQYLQKVFTAIMNNAELDSIEAGIGELLVSQAKSVIAMKKATSNIQQKMQRHKAELLAHLKKAHPVKSRIEPWVKEQLTAFEREFVLINQWSAHEDAISLCEEEDLDQAVYFLRRDLNFIKQREEILLKELSRVRNPDRVFTFSMRIWLPRNWVTMKTVEGEKTVVPTVIAGQDRRPPPEVHSPSSVFYSVNQYRSRKTSTRYPLWRWWNYLHRSWSWMWNSIFFFGVVMPWCSPFSIRSLLYVKPFVPNKKVSHEDGMLYPDSNYKTLTLMSRLSALWDNIRMSRQNFEATPDRGFLGKSLTRHFNRLWNYVIKGALGSLLLVLCFPVMCVVLSSGSLVLAVTAPAWAPVITLVAQLFCILFYDFDKPGDEVNAWAIVCEAIIWRLVICGCIQPVAATLFGFIGCPLATVAISAFGVVRRSLRGLWDTFMYQAVIKSRARVPARDSFVARRIAGPGLASNYFLQIQPEQALAALEATMEADELDVWKANTLKVIEKPAEDFRSFVSQVFHPFSADIISEGVYKQLVAETSNYTTDVTNKVSQRQWRLNTGLNFDVQNKVKLPEKELKMTILQAARMMEAFYPGHVIGQLSVSEDDYWERKQLEFRDWTGFASQKLSHIFSKTFLVPLESTDNQFQLKVQHVNLGRYIRLLDQSDFQDDLDLVTEVHTPTGEVTTKAPHLDLAYFNPSQKVVHTYRFRTPRKRRFPWSSAFYDAEFDKLEVPLPIPHPAVTAISIYNREHEQYALNFDDLFTHTLIKSIKSYPYVNVADPSMSDTPDNNSSPDNGVEPEVYMRFTNLTKVMFTDAEEELNITFRRSVLADQKLDWPEMPKFLQSQPHMGKTPNSMEF